MMSDRQDRKLLLEKFGSEMAPQAPQARTMILQSVVTCVTVCLCLKIGRGSQRPSD